MCWLPRGDARIAGRHSGIGRLRLRYAADVRRLYAERAPIFLNPGEASSRGASRCTGLRSGAVRGERTLGREPAAASLILPTYWPTDLQAALRGRRAPSGSSAPPTSYEAYLGALPGADAPGRQKAFVDWQHDVTVRDLALASREGSFLIRSSMSSSYTTTGMATDQGKTSNLNAMSDRRTETSACRSIRSG